MFIRDRVWGLRPVIEPIANYRLAGVYFGSELLSESESSMLKGLISVIGPGLGSYAISGGFGDRVLARGLGLLDRT